MRRMNIPERFWNTSFLEVGPSLQVPVKNYIKRMPDMLRRGTGFYFYGPAGVGKTSAGIVLMKAAYEKEKRCYYTTVKDLRQAIREEQSPDGDSETSMLQHCKDVDVLVLDDLAQDDFKNFVFGIGELEHLLNSRAARAKTTVLATRLTPDIFRTEYPSILQSMQGCFLSVACSGENLREQAAALLRKELGN